MSRRKRRKGQHTGQPRQPHGEKATRPAAQQPEPPPAPSPTAQDQGTASSQSPGERQKPPAESAPPPTAPPPTQPEGRGDANDLKLAELRLTATTTVQRHSRVALLSTVFLSLALMVTAFNAYIGWNGHFALASDFYGAIEGGERGDGRSDEPASWSGGESRPEPGDETSTGDAKDDAELQEGRVVTEAHKEALSDWVASRTLSVPALGIRLAIDDAAVIGSCAIALLMLIFALSMRREYHTIIALLRDTQCFSRRIRDYIYHHIVSEQTLSGDKWIGPQTATQSEESDHSSGSFSFLVFCFIPPAAIAFVIACDLASIYVLSAPFRLPHEPLIHFIRQGLISLGDTVKIVLQLGFGVVMGAASFGFSLKAKSYALNTAQQLRWYHHLP